MSLQVIHSLPVSLLSLQRLLLQLLPLTSFQGSCLAAVLISDAVASVSFTDSCTAVSLVLGSVVVAAVVVVVLAFKPHTD